jgi:hypothetical protein|tara:strand:- start:290 stop:466 length:177 start_codon:yes stop_codon:yes gene_type:complete
MFTLEELKEKLKQLDEITILETLEITSDDLIEKFVERIEQQQDTLEKEVDATTPWDNN